MNNVFLSHAQSHQCRFSILRFRCLIRDLTEFKTHHFKICNTHWQVCNQNNILTCFGRCLFISRVFKVMFKFRLKQFSSIFRLWCVRMTVFSLQVGTFGWPCIPNWRPRCGDVSTSDTTNAPRRLQRNSSPMFTLFKISWLNIMLKIWQKTYLL